MENCETYIAAYYRLTILREILENLPTYEWETVVRGVLDIPKKEEEKGDA